MCIEFCAFSKNLYYVRCKKKSNDVATIVSNHKVKVEET